MAMIPVTRHSFHSAQLTALEFPTSASKASMVQLLRPAEDTWPSIDLVIREGDEYDSRRGGGRESRRGRRGREGRGGYRVEEEEEEEKEEQEQEEGISAEEEEARQDGEGVGGGGGGGSLRRVQSQALGMVVHQEFVPREMLATVIEEEEEEEDGDEERKSVATGSTAIGNAADDDDDDDDEVEHTVVVGHAGPREDYDDDDQRADLEEAAATTRGRMRIGAYKLRGMRLQRQAPGEKKRDAALGQRPTKKRRGAQGGPEGKRKGEGEKEEKKEEDTTSAPDSGEKGRWRRTTAARQVAGLGALPRVLRRLVSPG